MELKDGVLRLLRERNGVSVHNEWLDACVEWILEEEVTYFFKIIPAVPNAKLLPHTVGCRW